eukprot:gene27265-biopygen1907
MEKSHEKNEGKITILKMCHRNVPPFMFHISELTTIRSAKDRELSGSLEWSVLARTLAKRYGLVPVIMYSVSATITAIYGQKGQQRRGQMQRDGSDGDGGGLGGEQIWVSQTCSTRAYHHPRQTPQLYCIRTEFHIFIVKLKVWTTPFVFGKGFVRGGLLIFPFCYVKPCVHLHFVPEGRQDTPTADSIDGQRLQNAAYMQSPILDLRYSQTKVGVSPFSSGKVHRIGYARREDVVGKYRSLIKMPEILHMEHGILEIFDQRSIFSNAIEAPSNPARERKEMKTHSSRLKRKRRQRIRYRPRTDI